ncbi:MAG: hypothetical protein KJ621_03725 [Proteobacteria bacterium]|nr:hypothetical protein [Pseudomonadota bacterium]MBU1743041.1 hypothetical protein [Pseudomonadota bacterium]
MRQSVHWPDWLDKVLVERGARMDIRNRAGRTPEEEAHELLSTVSAWNYRLGPIIDFLRRHE